VSPGDLPGFSPLMLCPCCCTLEDLHAFEHAHEADAPRVGGPPLAGCKRCGFIFPALPVEYRQLTLDAMRNHECRGVHDGNWPELGEAITQAIADLGVTQHELAEHLRGLWPGEDAS
jgi:hypothetical protein